MSAGIQSNRFNFQELLSSESDSKFDYRQNVLGRNKCHFNPKGDYQPKIKQKLFQSWVAYNHF